MAIAVGFSGLLGVTFTAAAQEVIKPFGRRIVGGERTNIKEHPWQVALLIRAVGGTNQCGGSIIGRKWVLTAAHCFSPSTKPDEVKTKAGATDVRREGSWSEIERVVLHESYNHQTFEHDIALVKLRMPPAGEVIPLAAASLSVKVGQLLEVTGWGATTEGGGGSPILLKANIPNADTVACNEPAAYNGRITAGMLCAGHRGGGVDSCQGDSGGPLVWRTPEGPVLVGVVSFGEGCARKLKYGVYTRVSAYREWIDGILTSDNRN